MAVGPALAQDGRVEPRDETLHRTVAMDDASCAQRIVIVNLSPHGFMARTQHDLAPGHRLTLDLPLAGHFTAEVRWSLGGRIGCQLDREIPNALYGAVLVAMRG